MGAVDAQDAGTDAHIVNVADWDDYLRFRPKFAEQLDPEWFPIRWLDHQIAAGAIVGFYGEKSAMLCEVRRYPGGAVVGGVFHALGDLREIMDQLRPEAEAWGHSVGCSEIVIEGRLGFVKALKAVGYEPHKSAVIKAL